MPTNLHGIHDNFDLASSHVIPAMIRRFLEAREEVVVGGDGTPRREFLYVDDLAKACVFLMKHYDEPGPINVGTGQDVTIAELVTLIATETGFQGEICWDASVPNGTPQKLLDVSKLTGLGWQPEVSLEDGIRRTIAWVQSGASVRGWVK
jgi:GDP-L-fucose synthase